MVVIGYNISHRAHSMEKEAKIFIQARLISSQTTATLSSFQLYSISASKHFVNIVKRVNSELQNQKNSPAPSP